MAYYQSALDNINNASTSEYYVAPASSTMDCPMLQKNQKTLTDQVKLWQDRYDSGNAKEKNNIQYIIATQKAKLTDYNNLVAAICQPATVPGQTPVTNVTAPPAGVADPLASAIVNTNTSPNQQPPLNNTNTNSNYYKKIYQLC